MKHHLLLCCLAMAEATTSGEGNFLVLSEVTVPMSQPETTPPSEEPLPDDDDASTSDTDDEAPQATLQSQPLRTLKRLQAMLDDSDYASSAVAPSVDQLWTRHDRAKYRRTRRAEKQRRDIQEQRYREMEREQIVRREREREELRRDLRRRETAQQEAMQRQFVEEFTDDETDTDGGGRGFTLPNLPVYLSDGETEEEGDERQRSSTSGTDAVVPSFSHAARRAAQMEQRDVRMSSSGQSHLYMDSRRNPLLSSSPHQGEILSPYHPYPGPTSSQQQQQYHLQQGAMPQYYPQSLNNPPHTAQGAAARQYPFTLNQQQQQMEHQQRHYEHQYTSWAQAAANGYHYPPPTPPPSYPQQQQMHGHPNEQHATYPPYTSSYPSVFQQQQQATTMESPTETHPYATHPGFFTRDTQQSNSQVVFPPNREDRYSPVPSMEDPFQSSPNAIMIEHNNDKPDASSLLPSDHIEESYCDVTNESAVIIAGAESKLSFDSIQKLVFTTLGVTLLSYCAVSPRSLSFPEYNSVFLHNLFTVGLGALPPLLMMLCVYDGKYNNINTLIGTFHVSFTMGYILVFVSEIIVTTLLRLGVFLIWEPAIFSLTPQVPTIILPWVLREKQYRPKRITLFACDFGASCIASPIIEEYLKLKIMQWTAVLPRNFVTKKIQKGKRKKKKDTLQPIMRNGVEVTNINCYVSQMMAASLGLKLVDTTRRILMYTKKSNDYKNFYAVCRGVFPIHELCGTMTALFLARRDVLGVQSPLWKILGPAVFIHGMANFRGMKPVFKWGSSTPWSEMQLYPWKVGSTFTPKQLLSTSYAKIVWCTILLRVFGFCVKNYYLIGRQAMKRVTTYSGKLYAFSAKLETDAMLKRVKEK